MESKLVRSLSLYVAVLVVVASLMVMVQASSQASAEEFVGGQADMDEVLEFVRRKLQQSSTGYYISYGALSANRVPCPPQSGRSYYTKNCQKASGPVRPYNRGCSTITRCARDG